MTRSRRKIDILYRVRAGKCSASRFSRHRGLIVYLVPGICLLYVKQLLTVLYYYNIYMMYTFPCTQSKNFHPQGHSEPIPCRGRSHEKYAIAVYASMNACTYVPAASTRSTNRLTKQYSPDIDSYYKVPLRDGVNFTSRGRRKSTRGNRRIHRLTKLYSPDVDSYCKVPLRDGVNFTSRGRRMSTRGNTGVPMICMSFCFSRCRMLRISWY